MKGRCSSTYWAREDRIGGQILSRAANLQDMQFYYYRIAIDQTLNSRASL